MRRPRTLRDPLWAWVPSLGQRGGRTGCSPRSPPSLPPPHRGAGAWPSPGLREVRAGRRGLRVRGPGPGPEEGALHTPGRTHRLAAPLQRQDLGPQLGDLPPLLVVGLHPERQHLRQLGHLLAGLGWGEAGQVSAGCLAFGDQSGPPDASVRPTPQLAQGTLGSQDFAFLPGSSCQ